MASDMGVALWPSQVCSALPFGTPVGGAPMSLTREAKQAGSASPAAIYFEMAMTGTQSQIEWAEEIRPRVGAEFDRVAQAFKTVAGTQTGERRIATLAVIDILEEKRADVMARTEAGYFIKDWRELSDQVRQMIAKDPRYQAIKGRRVPLKTSDTESA